MHDNKHSFNYFRKKTGFSKKRHAYTVLEIVSFIFALFLHLSYYNNQAQIFTGKCNFMAKPPNYVVDLLRLQGAEFGATLHGNQSAYKFFVKA